MMMNSKFARSLFGAMTAGALVLGSVACGGGEKEKQQQTEKTEKEQKTATETTRS